MADMKNCKKYLLCGDPHEITKKSLTFCMAPWIHIHILPDSSVIPCCVSPVTGILGNAQKQPLIEIWNGEHYRKLRVNMLLGIKSSGCHQCYKQEKSNISSFRNFFNKKYARDFNIVKTTADDGYVKEMRIRYFDVRFSNICNFKCRDCGATLSSAWFYENQKLYGYSSSGPRLINCTAKGTNRLWEQLEAFIPHVTIFNFAGGEPLLMLEHYKILDLLMHGKPAKYGWFINFFRRRNKIRNILLTYVTNFSVTGYKGHNVFTLWRNFKRINLYVSIDDICKRGEYFRKGLQWEKLLENLTLLKKNAPHVRLVILTTINMHNVYYFPEIYRFFVQNNYIKENQLEFKMLITPEELSVQVLPKEFKKRVENKLISSVSMLKQLLPGRKLNYYRHSIENIIDFLNKEDQSHLLSEFQRRTAILDELRNENFADVYPELAFLMDENIRGKKAAGAANDHKRL
jgi:sulfatase maturation enzyme AslB (radical SAM superfamily)